uniref:Palladin-like n=1 Tax=Phallusia mammillata TaxID=59560 RepID=A0A6F9DNC9_9ASCI|nr:palladin-like [Phallusia mammillata]
MSHSPKSGDTAPHFHKPLKDLSTTQGECIVLECRVKGQPPPVITWKREGDVIEDCPDFRLLHRGEVATLVIGEAFPEDSGRFICEASNSAGTTTTSCKLAVRGGGYHTVSTKSAAAPPPSILNTRPTQVLPAHHSTTSSHGNATTTTTTSDCGIISSERPILVSKLNIIPKNPRIFVVENSCPTISSTHDSNADVPTPQSVASTGNNNFPREPVVVLSPSPSPTPRYESPTLPTITPPMTTAFIKNVDHNADENHNFKAEKDRLVDEVARNISSPPTRQIKQKNSSSRELAFIERDIAQRLSLSASPPLPSPEQEYKVSNFEQRLMNEIEYRLERTPPVNEDPDDAIFDEVSVADQASPTFISRLKNFKALDCTSAKFTCQVSAKPTAKVFWFKDGKQISKRSQHYVQKVAGGGHHELLIAHLCLEDDGNYTALAINPQGRTSSTGRLAMISEKHTPIERNSTPINTAGRSSSPRRSLSPRMLSPPRSVSPSASPDSVFKMPDKGELAADEESPVEKYYRPTFIQKPHADTKVDEGKLVRFDVKVTGLPTPDIEWLINGLPVRQDSLHKVLVRENNVHSLLLERASPMDEGQYTIVARNKAGSASAHVQLHVTPREYMTAPAFVQRLSAQTVADGDPVRLEARVVGTPKPVISWKKGSDQVLTDGRHQLYQDESGYVCLQITRTAMKDAAWYTCSATNKAGISSCNCKLDVYSPTSDIPSNRRRIRTPHRYANLAKVAGVDMREALTPDAQANHCLPESEEL